MRAFTLRQVGLSRQLRDGMWHSTVKEPTLQKLRLNFHPHFFSDLAIEFRFSAIIRPVWIPFCILLFQKQDEKKQGPRPRKKILALYLSNRMSLDILISYRLLQGPFP